MDREILIRFLKCETTPEEETVILQWLEADPEHRKEMNRLDVAHNAMVLHAPDIAEVRRKSVFSLRRMVHFAAGVAAAVLLIAGSGWFFTNRQMNRLSEQMTVVNVPEGQRINMKLQDGTTIWLNAGTTLEYPMAFAANSRRVKVSGEAMFDVVHDPQRPFIVETFACKVEVLGTKFNVVADEPTEKFSTALIRGRVKVINRLSDNEQVILDSNECVSLVGGHLDLERIENPEEFLWTEGIISLKGASFEELIAKLEKAYAVKIIVRRDKLPHLECRGKIRISEGIEHAIRILQTGADFSYEFNWEANELYIK